MEEERNQFSVFRFATSNSALSTDQHHQQQQQDQQQHQQQCQCWWSVEENNRTNINKCDKCGVDYSEAMIKVEKDSWYCWLCPACNLFYPSHLHSFLIPLYCCCQLSSANKLKQRLENLFWKMKLHCVQSLKIRSIDTKSRTHHRVPKYKGFALTFYGASLINVQFTLSRVGGTSLRHHKNCEYCPKLRFTLDNISSEWVTRPLLSNCGEMKGMHLKVWNWVAAKVSDTSSVLWCLVGTVLRLEISLQASYAVGDLCDDRELVSSGGFDKREQANLHNLNTAATWINKNFCISRFF